MVTRSDLTARGPRTLLRTVLPAALLALAGLMGGLAGGCADGAGMGPSGQYILCVNDADMAASAWADQQLGDRDPAATDTLTVITLPLRNGEPPYETPFAQINVSNSALCPPTCLSVSRDGRFAFVVEYRGPAGADAKTVADLPIGNKVTAIDLSSPLKPVVASVAEVSKQPISVAVNPEGNLVAVVAQQPRQQIVVLPFANGQFSGEPTAWPLIGLDAEDAKPTSVAWHPAGTALAVTLQDRGEVVFYRFKRGDDGRLALSPWGQPVKAGKAPYAGAFTPDGRHFVVNDVQWGQDVQGYNVGAPQGQLVSIRLADMAGGPETAQGGAADHLVVSSVQVGVSPVGMAISNDGTLIATANLQRSYLREGDPRASEGERGGSLSLVAIAGDGTLTHLAEAPINAVPAGVCFDGKDKHVCVTQFRSFDPEAKSGELGFWTVKPAKGSDPAALEPTNLYVGVGVGPHGVLIVR